MIQGPSNEKTCTLIEVVWRRFVVSCITSLLLGLPACRQVTITLRGLFSANLDPCTALVKSCDNKVAARHSGEVLKTSLVQPQEALRGCRLARVIVCTLLMHRQVQPIFLWMGKACQLRKACRLFEGYATQAIRLTSLALQVSQSVSTKYLHALKLTFSLLCRFSS